MMEKKSREIGPDINLSDNDIYEAMKDIQGYLDITPADLKEIYRHAYRHATERINRSVSAKEIMTTPVIMVKLHTSLDEVARTMAINGISGVPVLSYDNTVAGVISEKDFLRHMGAGVEKSFMGIVAECLNGENCMAISVRGMKAEDIMTSPAVTVDENATVKDISDLFNKKNINRVPVVDKGGRLIGIVSRWDIIRASSR